MISLRNILRKQYLYKQKVRIVNPEVTIISSNCVGGVIYHDLGLRFMSPTINLFMRPKDFIIFCSNLPYYLKMELNELDTAKPYPCGELDGLRIDFMHYTCFDEAKAKWNERCKRVNLNNLCAIMVNRDGCTIGDAIKFDSLPIQNKVFLTGKHFDGIKCELFNNNWFDESECTRDLCAFKGKVSVKRWIDEFDYVNFINHVENDN